LASNPLQNRVKWFNAQGTWESAVSLFEVMLMLMLMMLMMMMVMMVMMVNVMNVMNDDDATA
jgi:hypothetical protein